MTNGFAKFIMAASRDYGLNPQLIAALIHQESGGNPFAVRYEDDFFGRYLTAKTLPALGGYIPVKCSGKTEKRLRACSFGLCQIMGQVARERGFGGEFLTELIDPETNIRLGASILKGHIDKAGSTEGGLLKYNGGGNKDYPQEVLHHIQSGAYQYLLIS